jgi:hypothetical protein
MISVYANISQSNTKLKDNGFVKSSKILIMNRIGVSWI